MTLSSPSAGRRTLTALLLSLQLGVPAALAQTAPDPGGDGPKVPDGSPAASAPRHRLDSSLSFLDTVDLDSLHLEIAYTYSLTPNANLSLTLPLVDGDVDKRGGYGIGDLGLSVSFTPFTAIAANPWVPKTVGTGLAAVLPTGNPDKNRGQGVFVLGPFVGGVFFLSDRFFVTPQLGYFHSFGEPAAGVDIRLGTASIGLTFVSFNGFWVAPLVELARDFEAGELAFNYDIIVGKMFSSGLGVSVWYFDYELLDPVTGAGRGRAGDRQIAVNLHVTF
jgi:hypothetical protein